MDFRGGLATPIGFPTLFGRPVRSGVAGASTGYLLPPDLIAWSSISCARSLLRYASLFDLANVCMMCDLNSRANSYSTCRGGEAYRKRLGSRAATCSCTTLFVAASPKSGTCEDVALADSVFG